MKIKDLITLLGQYDPELEVVMSKDAEGNGFSPLHDGEKGLYSPKNTWSGEFYGMYDLEEEPANAICLWPVN